MICRCFSFFPFPLLVHTPHHISYIFHIRQTYLTVLSFSSRSETDSPAPVYHTSSTGKPAFSSRHTHPYPYSYPYIAYIAYTHIHTYTRIHTHTHTHTYTQIDTHTHTYTHTYTHTHASTQHTHLHGIVTG